MTGPNTHQALAPGFELGKRFHSAPVIRLADAKPMQLGHAVEADAHFRIFLFAPKNDTGAAGGQIAKFCDWLSHDPASPLRQHTALGADVDALIDIRAVFQLGFRDLNYESMPALLRPHVGRYGLCDYEKVFCVNHRSEDVFEARGIDRQQGCLVIVRPDQYVGHVLPLVLRDVVSAYFAAIFKGVSRTAKMFDLCKFLSQSTLSR